MKIPFLHLNGTKPSVLTDAIDQAAEAIRKAMVKLAETRPNQRDYYPMGNDDFNVAVEEYANRMRRLQSVEAELMEMWEKIRAVIDGVSP